MKCEWDMMKTHSRERSRRAPRLVTGPSPGSHEGCELSPAAALSLSVAPGGKQDEPRLRHSQGSFSLSWKEPLDPRSWDSHPWAVDLAGLVSVVLAALLTGTWSAVPPGCVTRLDPLTL